MKAAATEGARPPERRFWEMTGYQWAVLFAAWLGWGFDVFDGLLFNFVAPNCVPTLLGLPIGSPEARAATLRWTGAFSSLLLVGWAAGGILFGRLADRIGRTRTLTLTMLVYAGGTALCAFAPNLWVLGLFRLISALGIGGEWVGLLLWPAVALHAVLSIGCFVAIRRRDADAGDPDRRVATGTEAVR